MAHAFRTPTSHSSGSHSLAHATGDQHYRLNDRDRDNLKHYGLYIFSSCSSCQTTHLLRRPSISPLVSPSSRRRSFSLFLFVIFIIKNTRRRRFHLPPPSKTPLRSRECQVQHKLQIRGSVFAHYDREILDAGRP